MSEPASIIYPSGLIGDINFVAPQPSVGPSVGQNHQGVTQLLAGANIQERGTGSRKVLHAGLRGTLEAYVTTGAGGMTQNVVALSAQLDVYTPYMALALDANNRPFVVVQDAAGNSVAESAPTGASISAGQPLVLRLVWDSTRLVQGLRYAALKVNNAFVPVAEWSVTDPLAAWTSFRIQGLQIGLDVPMALSSMTGTVNKVQLSPLVVL